MSLHFVKRLKIVYFELDRFCMVDIKLTIKVDREDHTIICVFLGYRASNFVKKLDVTDV